MVAAPNPVRRDPPADYTQDIGKQAGVESKVVTVCGPIANDPLNQQLPPQPQLLVEAAPLIRSHDRAARPTPLSVPMALMAQPNMVGLMSLWADIEPIRQTRIRPDFWALPNASVGTKVAGQT